MDQIINILESKTDPTLETTTPMLKFFPTAEVTIKSSNNINNLEDIISALKQIVQESKKSQEMKKIESAKEKMVVFPYEVIDFRISFPIF